MTHTSEYREKCLAEYGEQCSVCDSEDEIVAHHIDGDRPNHDLDNLTPLCKSCHQKVHSGSVGVCDDIEALQSQLLPPEEQRGETTMEVTKAQKEVLKQAQDRLEEELGSRPTQGETAAIVSKRVMEGAA